MHPEIQEAKNLQSYFFGRLVDLIGQKELMIGGWEEVAMIFREDGSWVASEEFTGKNVIPYVWNSIWGNQDLGYRLANSGYPIIMCNVDNYYFDLAYNKHPEEPGLYWGGFVDTRDGFEFILFDLYKSMTVDPMGIPYDPERDFRNMEHLKPEARKNILGLQGELWSETIKGEEMLEYYYLPKLLGLAQRAWQGQADWGLISDKNRRMEMVDEEWNIFANTVGQREFPRLDYLFGGFNYRIPVPGARIINGKLEANLAYPGMIVRYTLDGSEPGENSEIYTEPVEVTGSVNLRAFNTKGRGGRSVTVE
jgi:hexosaminidase